MFWRTILWDWTHVTHSRMQLSEKVGGGSSGAICWGQESCVMCWAGAGVTVKHSTVAAVGPEERKAFQSEGHTETAGRGISVWGFFFSVLLLCEQLVAHCTACVWAFPWQCSCSQERQWISFAFFRITENHFAKSVLAKRTSKRTATQNVSRKSQLKMFVPTFLLWRTKCT